MTDASSPIRHSVRVRYGECDMQGVVFNAHYLAYFDDAMDHLLRSSGWSEGDGWEIMLKRSEITWHGAAGVDDVIDIDLAVTRWGTTSFDVAFHGSVDGETKVECATTYVVVGGEPLAPKPVPDRLRSILD